ncbi:hypothetical protein, partial [uncultured Acetatifactor sp.]|uniref:hypothetical protein n=1 Tax=uncultured Acetatifactor sp. TaxID=1671927 RepID=UPI00262D800D
KGRFLAKVYSPENWETFNLSDKNKDSTAILIYDNQNYYFDIEDYDKISQFYWRPNNKGYLAHWFAVYDSQGKR